MSDTTKCGNKRWGSGNDFAKQEVISLRTQTARKFDPWKQNGVSTMITRVQQQRNACRSICRPICRSRGAQNTHDPIYLKSRISSARKKGWCNDAIAREKCCLYPSANLPWGKTFSTSERRESNYFHNHKNYNFLACDWFKNVLFSTNSLAKLLSDSLLLDSLLLDSLLSDSLISQSHSKL